ncbi:MAG: tetratricopeptide repeat protein [Nannocystaceae bacterium]
MDRRAALLLTLCLLPGCVGSIPTMVVLIVFGISVMAVALGRDRRQEALREAETLRRAIASGRHRKIEAHLRKQLALAAAGEAIPIERQWLLRAQLGGLLVAEWRLEEAAAVYGDLRGPVSPLMRALAAYGHHELRALTGHPGDDTDAQLASIREDRERCLQLVPATFHRTISLAWDALEGLCLARAGRPRDAEPLLTRGLGALEYNPARVIYLFHLGQALEQLGELTRAAARYEEAMVAFPGTRLADEARARLRSLSSSSDASFRRMLPEAPEAAVDPLLEQPRDPDA